MIAITGLTVPSGHVVVPLARPAALVELVVTPAPGQFIIASSAEWYAALRSTRLVANCVALVWPSAVGDSGFVMVEASLSASLACAELPSLVASCGLVLSSATSCARFLTGTFGPRPL